MSSPSASLCAAFQQSAAAGPDEPALAMAGHPGFTWAEYAGAVHRLAAGFVGLGVGAGDTVALLTGPRPEFHVVDTALLHARATPYSLQVGDTVPETVERMRTARSSLLVTEQRLLPVAREVAAAVPYEVPLVSVDGGGRAGELTVVEVERLAPAGLDVDGLWHSVGPQDIATLIFTAGTTGAPKAVQLSHRAILAAERSTFALAPSAPGGDVLSYLPLNHIAERFMSHYAAMTHGLTVHSVPDPDLLYDEIRRVRPTRFFGIPRVYEKLVDWLSAELDAEPSLEADRRVALRAVRAEQRGERLAAADAEAADDAVANLAGLRATVGLDRAEYLGVATAPSAYPMLEFLLSVGLRVSDIWGMSEVIMCTLNPPGAIRLGTVGRFLDGMEGRIAEDGEILVRGAQDFSGYLGDPARTAEIQDRDGWVHTGDVGSIDNGYLTIRGRKKEILITATGKNVAPSLIEGAVKSQSPLMDHVVAVADGRRYVTVLVALDPTELARWASARGLDGDFATLAHRDDVRDEITTAVTRANAGLSHAEGVRAFHIVDQPWSPGGDEITATAKLRRGAITRKYADEIEELYP